MISFEHILHLVFKCFQSRFWACDCSHGRFFPLQISKILWFLHWKCYISSKFFKEWVKRMKECFLKILFPTFKAHFRLVQMALKSITFVQNHKVVEHFITIMHILTIFFILLVREQISCVKIKGAIIIHAKFSSAQKLKI